VGGFLAELDLNAHTPAKQPCSVVSMPKDVARRCQAHPLAVFVKSTSCLTAAFPGCSSPPWSSSRASEGLK
jgi:hypothetical protein